MQHVDFYAFNSLGQVLTQFARTHLETAPKYRCALVHRRWAGEHMRPLFAPSLLQARGAGCLELRAYNEGLLRPRVARARETPAPPAVLLLFALHGNVQNISLTIDQQKR